MSKTEIPSIRFRGFDNAWEQRKFSDVVTTRRGLTYKPSDIRKNGVRVLRSSNIAEDSFTLGDEDVFVVREAVNIDCARANDILITAANGSSRLVGKHTIITGIPEESAVHGGFMLLGTTKEPHFVNASMGSSWYRRFIELFVAGGNGAIGNLSKNDLDNQEIAIPSEEEQKIIGSFFRQLDHLITLHQRKFEKLTNVKKSMLEKMFPQNGSCYPEIRFKGFTDPWEQRKFGEVFMSLQNNTLSRAELNDEFGAAQNIHYGDVLIKYDEILDVSKEPLSYIEKQSIADKFKTSYLQNGDVIIADTAEDETVGKCTEIEGLTDQKVISGLHTMPVRPNRKFASGFLGFYLNSAAYHDQLKPLMQGIKVTSISKGAMQDTVVKFPLDLKEQEQIGIYFGGLDHLITLHQRELEKLQSIKKALLEKMFV